jgi:flagellar biosynthetic protein FliR
MEISLQQAILGVLTISVRFTGLFLFAPFFGSAAIPARVKAALVFSLSLLLYPVLADKLGKLGVSGWPGLLLTELLVGAGMGIATNLVFDAVQMAGQVMSTQMGFSMVNLIDPQTQVDSTVMALLHQTLTMLIFLRLNIHIWMLRVLATSFRVLPVGTHVIQRGFAMEAVTAGGLVFAMGLQLAAPVLVATVLADIVGMLLTKAAPQIHLMTLMMPVKTLLCFAVLFASLKYWPQILQRFFEASLQRSEQLLWLAR